MTDASLANEVAAALASVQGEGVDLDSEVSTILDAARRDAPSGDGVRDKALGYARERASGKPLAYVIGRVRFLGVELVAAPGALVPRAETEIVGRAALEAARALAAAEPSRALRVIDMCCGAGNLACAIAFHVPSARVWACDLTPSCVAVARRNVEHLGLGARVEVFEGDLFAPLQGRELEGTIDVLVANPPYISTSRLAADRAALLEHEPREAFDGGPYGLTIHQRVIREGQPFLVKGGSLLFEFGLGQERQVELLFQRARAYEGFRTLPDEAGHPRAAAAKKQ
jgi:release factor glutamine methyltransferase